MKKRMIGILVAIVLVITSVVAYNQFNKEASTVYAAEFRDGYMVEPTSMDGTGVKLDSDFNFKWEGTVPAQKEELEVGLSVSPKFEFTISEAEEGFIIHPTASLDANTIYVFDYQGITWAYKTEADFALLGTFPRNQTTNVPTNTGIEFVFNYEGAQVEDYFSIEPEVKGSFENHGRVVVFVPKELQEKTVYTVTLKEGLTLTGSEKNIKEATSFSFETESVKSEDKEPNGYMNFTSLINEFKTSEVPSIQWDYYTYNDKADKEVKATIYGYKDALSFMKDIDEYNHMPYWSFYGMEDLTIDTEKLSKVKSFDYELTNDGSYPQFLTLPDKLDPGFYLVDALWEDSHIQTFVQVTDLSFYYTQNTNGDLFWVNNLETQKALEGVTITNYVANKDGALEKGQVVQSDNTGIGSFLGERASTSGETKMYILEKDQQQAVLFSMNSNFWYRGYGNDSNYFWKYFKSDRSLYQPDDQVEFFGYLQGRYENIDMDKVTVEVTQGGYYYFAFLPYNVDQLSYVVEEVEVQNGFFKGNLQLPNLAQGGYELVVKYEGERIGSTYISVENYVKPSYKIEVSRNKEAIFADEEVVFTVKSQFFEGTPVSYLDYNYNIGGIDYTDGNETTDKKGESIINYTPKYISGYQGEQYYYFNAFAELPESGSIYVEDNLRVFFNDINVSAMGKLEGEKGSIELQVDTITLDRINNGEAKDSNDYLDQPLGGLKVNGKIIRNEWIKTEQGEYYDFINKEVRKQYDYHLEETTFDEVTLVTDDKGGANLDLTLPKEDNVYYTGELTTKDQQGRNMNFHIYFGDYSRYEPNWGDYYHVELDKESYNLSDDVQMTFKNGQEAYEDGRYLFLAGQNGLVDYKLSDGPKATMKFSDKFMPNVEITGVYFNGTTYIDGGGAQARFDYAKKNINLDIKTDKEAYKPGETVTIDISATVLDENGNAIPVKDAMVNLGLVDEALLALSDQYIDPLGELYQYVSSGLYQTYASHRNQNSGFGPLRGGYGMAMDGAEMVTTEAVMDSNQSEMKVKLDFADVAATESEGGSVRVRSEFKDTALFMTLKLSEEGKGTYTFTLPDNVTSWRMTAAGISNSLMAGSQVEAVNVSLPFFLNTSISHTYLVGDRPQVGVTAYGNDLIDNENIQFSVEVYEEGQTKASSMNQISGLAYERVNLPLGQLNKAGNYKVVVTGKRADGLGDAIELKVNVVETYHEQTVTDYYTLTEGLNITTNQSGNTILHFIDEGKGYYLPGLYSLAYSGGKRVDQKYMAALVQGYLNEHFGAEFVIEDVEVTDYLTPSGGLAILPYGEGDLLTTVNMLPLVKDALGDTTLLLYLQNAWYDKNITEKGPVLYGLSVLGEPVLYDLNTYAKASNLSIKDRLFLSLAYENLGDTYKAKEMYDLAITSQDKSIEEFDDRAYVKLGANEDENYELTALAMVITEKLGMDIHDKFYDYLMNNYSKEVLVNTYMYAYIMNRLEIVSEVVGSISYNYNGKEVEVNLTNGYGASVSIPSATLNQFKITKVIGDLAVIASYEAPIKDSIKNDSSIHVSRKYYNYQTGEAMTTFKEGDIVKVVLDWEVKDEAIDNWYRLTDFAPAGLKPINNPWQLGLRGAHYWYRDVEDQKVSFYIYKDRDDHTYEPLVYFARIASIGQYNAEAPMIQGSIIKDSMYIGEQDTIIITD